MNKRKREEYEYRGMIGVILAACLAFFLLAFAVFAAIEAWHDPTGRGALSENATQILSTVAGGIIGILAGFTAGAEAASSRQRRREDEANPEPDMEAEPYSEPEPPYSEDDEA